MLSMGAGALLINADVKADLHEYLGGIVRGLGCVPLEINGMFIQGQGSCRFVEGIFFCTRTGALQRLYFAPLTPTLIFQILPPPRIVEVA